MKNRYPTAAELYALELEARRLRSAEMARLLIAAIATLRGWFTIKATKGFRHAQ